MIRDVLVHVDPTTAGAARLDYAAALAARHGARLTGAHVLAPVDVPPYFRPWAVEREARLLEHEAQQAAVAAKALFAARMGVQGRPDSRWFGLTGDMKQALCAQAACADLVVLGQYEAEGTVERHPLTLAEEVAPACGRPVLVTPDRIDASAPLRRALIGWDAGREAVRAVHDAIPLLLQSDCTVEILVAGERTGAASDRDLVDHLKRHGVRLDPEVPVHVRGSAEDALARRLAEGAFDLLVMGAYSRPAWLEFLFGGPTQAALTRADVPVFVSH